MIWCAAAFMGPLFTNLVSAQTYAPMMPDQGVIYFMLHFDIG